MDNWLSDRFGGDYRAMRRRSKELWWSGWTSISTGAIPLILGWAFADLPRGSLIAGLSTAIPDWMLFGGMVAIYIGFALALASWYLRGLSKRVQYSL